MPNAANNSPVPRNRITRLFYRTVPYEMASIAGGALLDDCGAVFPRRAVPVVQTILNHAGNRATVPKRQLDPAPSPLLRKVNTAEKESRHQVADFVGGRFIGNRFDSPLNRCR